MSSNINNDIDKIINAKRTLYEKILQKLEKKANENVLDGSQRNISGVHVMTGGAELEDFTGEIKIIGHINLPHVSDADKVEFRLAKITFPQVMSIEQAHKYSELISKKSA